MRNTTQVSRRDTNTIPPQTCTYTSNGKTYQTTTYIDLVSTTNGAQVYWRRTETVLIG